MDPADLSPFSAIALFYQLLAGAVWLSIAQTLFDNRLVVALSWKFGPSRAHQLVTAGPSEMRKLVSAEELPTAIQGYMEGLKDAYTVSIALGSFASLVAIAAIVFDRRKLGKGAA